MLHHRFISTCVPVLAVAIGIGLSLTLDSTSARADEFSPQILPEGGAATEAALIEVLRTGAPADKAICCKRLAIRGTKDSVPELAKLLSDDHLASWARIALEAIPDPAAGEALRKAETSLQGKLLVGVINSIGVRRDAKAVDQLTGRLQDKDKDVTAAAAVALGSIGNDAAAKALRGALTGNARAAVAEGCIVCAEHLLADGHTADAITLYNVVRGADVPKQRVVEATRGVILARKAEGIPQLVELIKSSDKAMFNIAQSIAREMPGREVSAALAAEVSRVKPDRAALLVALLGDRNDPSVVPALLDAARKGDKQVRIAALAAVGRAGDVASVPALVEVAADTDADLAQGAKSALANLPGNKVDQDIVARLRKADGKDLAVLLDVVGRRRIEATPDLERALANGNPAVHNAAIAALGETVAPKDLAVVVSLLVSARNSEDEKAAAKALRAAALRLPGRETTSANLTKAMGQLSPAGKVAVLEILGAMGGPKALETIAATMKSGDDQLQDAGSRALGEWMSLDAGPVLLDLTKSASSGKYKGRALRGYLRLARQFAESDRQRAEMCQAALDALTRADDQKLVLAVLEQFPNTETLNVAAKATKIPAVKDEATRAAMSIAQKIGAPADVTKQLLETIGLEPVKIEIIKAEYGAGDKKKDVTDVLKQQVRNLPLISLPLGDYNINFGDPAAGVKKELKIQYRMNGKAGEATFSENAALLLPVPK